MSFINPISNGEAVEPTITTTSGQPDTTKKLAIDNDDEEPTTRTRSPPPKYPAAEASSSSPRPPPFSSLYTSTVEAVQAYKASLPDHTTVAGPASPAYAPPFALAASFTTLDPTSQLQSAEQETKAALPRDTKGDSSSRKKEDDSEPPPAYEEGSSPLESFTYLMAAAGGAASIITQVQQGGAPPINTLGGIFWKYEFNGRSD